MDSAGSGTARTARTAGQRGQRGQRDSEVRSSVDDASHLPLPDSISGHQFAPAKSREISLVTDAEYRVMRNAILTNQ